MMRRRETDIKKGELVKHVCSLCTSTSALEGAPLPTHRELAAQFGLSTFTVSSVLQTLVRQGVLESQQGVGVFARRQLGPDPSFAFLVHQSLCPRTSQIYQGFSAELAERGFSCVLLTSTQAERLCREERGGSLRGVLSFHREADAPSGTWFDLPAIGFYDLGDPSWDSLAFDDEGGGEAAAAHLASCGHRSIAYLGAHYLDEAGPFNWSQLRMEGTRKKAEEAGMSFRHVRNALPPGSHHVEVGLAAVDRVLDSGDGGAVVAANSLIAAGFLAGLRKRKVSWSLWPAIVGFHDSDVEPVINLTALHLPYVLLGRSGARRLLERAKSPSKGSSEIVRVPLRLIPSLTSYSGWAGRSPALAKDMAWCGGGTPEPSAASN